MGNGLSGLCNGCIAFYRKHISLSFCTSIDSQLIGSATAIPRDFLENPRILELISHDTGSSTSSGVETHGLSPIANSILGGAVTHQQNASESRIGVQVRKGLGVAKSDGAGLPRFKGLSKPGGSGSVSIIAERKSKKTDWLQQQSASGPKFSITLWKSRGVEDKLKQV